MYSNIQYQYNKFIETIHGTRVYNSSFRDILDNGINYNYETNPIVFYNDEKINHIMVNTIRHTFSDYEPNLKVIHKLRTVYNAYPRYKNSVLTSIAKEYPFLEKECDKQKMKINMVRVVEKSTT